MNITPYTPNFFTELPQDVLFDVAFGGNPQDKTALDAIIALRNLSEVDWTLKNKIDNCWNLFILYAGTAALLISPLSRPIDYSTLNAVPSRDVIIKQFRILIKCKDVDLKKLRNGTPSHTEQLLPSAYNPCVAINHNGNAEMWKLITRKVLQRTDLTTSTSSNVNLQERIKPFSSLYNPCVALSEKHVAICTDKDSKLDMEIAIIDISTGACQKISGMKNVQKLFWEGQYLYVLCANKQIFKFLQYDSLNWKSPPEELSISEEKTKDFYSAHDHWLFVIDREEGFQLYATEKKSCFSNPYPSFINTAPQKEYPRFESVEDHFLTISRDSDSSFDEPMVILEQLCFNDSSIEKKPLLKFPFDIKKMGGFHLQLDKIFIRKREWDDLIADYDYSISCFDLATGKLINNFVPETKEDRSTLLRPVMLKLPNKNTQLVYSSENPITHAKGTTIFTLDFSIDEKKNNKKT